MKKRYERALKVAGITFLSAGTSAVVAYGATSYLMRMAMDRKMPKAARKAGSRIAGKKADDDFMKALRDASRKLEEMPSEKVTITAHDGTNLVGHWIPAIRPKRIIIAMHGWRSSWCGDFGIVSDAWRNNDCSVLYVEQRGQNNSGGEFIGFGLTERYDCVDWANWVVEKYGDTLPIYLAGVSMGATTVLLASELDLPACVHGIMSDCGFTSPDDIWKHIAVDNLHLVYGIKGKIADELYQKRTNEVSDRYSTIDALKNTDIPVLFVHGSDDHFVPVTMTYENYKACASPKHLLIVPGADHGMSYYIDKKQYEKTAVDFWNKYDSYQRKSTLKEKQI